MRLFDALREREAPRLPQLAVRGVIAGAKGYCLARLFAEQRRPLLVVTPDARQRDLLYHDLRCFLCDPSTLSSAVSEAPAGVVHRYISPIPGPSDAIAYQQQRALFTYQPLWRLLRAEPVVVVTDAASLRYGVVPAAILEQSLVSVKVGAFCELDRLVPALVDRGYRRVSLVETVGEFSLRGGILDLFSPGQDRPWRIEFFGDEVETIRTFDVASQVSVASLSSITVAPMHPLSRRCLACGSGVARLRRHLQAQGWSPAQVEAYLERWRTRHPVAWPWGIDAFFYESVQSLLTYLPATGLLCCVDAEDVALLLQQEAVTAAIPVGEASVPLPQTVRIPSDALVRQLQERTHVVFLQYDPPPTTAAVTTLHTRGAPQFFGVLDRFIAQMRQWRTDGFCILLLSHFCLEAQRMQGLLAEYDIGSRVIVAPSETLLDETIMPGAVLISVGEVSQGFVLPEARLVVVRAEEIFGEKKRARPSVPARSPQARIDFGALQPGDRVVHVDHGVGLYRRMTFLDVERDRGEFMEIEYADGARLYVPSYRLSMVQKYAGSDAEDGHLDRLGGSSWARTKERVKAALFAMAEDLIRLDATRQTRPGYRFSHDTALHREFESGFEYAETEDQLRAIQQVVEDMEQPRPMERLVCGDVGYGKTEVAMRAAFKAAYDGKQVAVLVPTTVLAQQHYETFRRRFAAYPIEIDMLSRMRTRKAQQQVLDGLRHGRVDIVIGTHRLLQKDVQFKDLGLLVVDEEHRFGVAHKEQIKRLSTHIDVLMLTATPIPRSLQMALVGLRHFSIIETPPEGRNAIQTMVTPFAEEVIQSAIQRELARGGQVFFVHNHIDTLPAMHAVLRRLVPECRVGIAHGQMPERALEKTMLRFLAREFDLLLCTTIIESGLDIPSVNTIIIHRADRFGLAQLYQLRGRVGRSTQQAYAYLLIPGEAVLSDTARKRIDAIEEFSELGSSFQLAARDLEIRGAGNLLGAQQSGHIARVGFQLYCQMLEEAIRTTQGEAPPVRLDPELRLEIQGYIPTAYIEREAQRLGLYQRLATVEDRAALDAMAQELQDRFGALPEAVQRLFAVVEIKILARQLAVERLEQRSRAVVVTFHPQTPVRPEPLLHWLQSIAPGFRFQSERVVRLPIAAATPEARLAILKKHLQQLLASGSI